MILQDCQKSLSETKVADRDESVIPRKLRDADAHAVWIGDQTTGVVVARREILITVLDAAEGKSVDLQAELVHCVGICVDLMAHLALSAAALKEQLAETRDRMSHLGKSFRDVFEGNGELASEWVDHDHCLAAIG